MVDEVAVAVKVDVLLKRMVNQSSMMVTIVTVAPEGDSPYLMNHHYFTLPTEAKRSVRVVPVKEIGVILKKKLNKAKKNIWKMLLQWKPLLKMHQLLQVLLMK